MSDLISRQAAIKAIDDLPNCYNGYSDTYDKAYIIGVLEELPPIEPKRVCEYWDGESGFCALQRPADHVKHGKWLWGAVDVRCSNCGQKLETTGMPMYCPNCGAQMERS